MDGIRTDEEIKEAVRQTYGDRARRFVEQPSPCTAAAPSQTSCCGPSQPASCCGPAEATVEMTDTAARLYSLEELAGLPVSVTGAAAGCGNPTAIAQLQPGDVVLDLGSGGGIDCFLAAKQVGPEGKVIGVDMTPDMVRLARRNAKKVGTTNVEFRFGEMEDIPLPDESVDVIISNCVINLSPDKDAVFGEAYRLLRPGGRMSISDIVLNAKLPEAIRDRLDAWAGCIAGALEESDYLAKIRAAGFEQVEVLASDCACLDQEFEGEVGVSAADLADAVASIKVTARKPAHTDSH